MEFTAGLRGNLGEFGDYFKTWDWESGFRYSEDDRTERLGGIVNTSALRAALLDTNPATAFNPFGINQNSPAVIDKVFVTTHRFGKALLVLEDLKLNGDLWNVPAGPIGFAVGGEHWSEHATDQPDPLTASGQTIGLSLPPAKARAHLTSSQPMGAGMSGPSIGRFVSLSQAQRGTFPAFTAWS